jgi:pimeloyl-ACP methyl ester carboxylesterase
MDCSINGATIHYVEHGTGVPLLALHGAGVDHREIEAAIEAVIPATGYRRIYPDLPGMGRSTADGLAGNDDVVQLLGELIDDLAGGPALVLGHSYGAYLARGVAAQRPDAVRGLALLCPTGERSADVPDHRVVRQDPDAYAVLEDGQRAGFDEYFVIRTPATARRYRDHVVPGTSLVDETALGRIFSAWTIDLGSHTVTSPTLIAAGRRDSIAGYAAAVELLDRYPRAALTVIEDAGHALMHERPDLLGALLTDWLDRAGVLASDPARTQ